MANKALEAGAQIWSQETCDRFFQAQKEAGLAGHPDRALMWMGLLCSIAGSMARDIGVPATKDAMREIGGGVIDEVLRQMESEAQAQH